MTETGGLRTTLGSFHLILYPFIDGHSGFEVGLADHHWVELGRALRRIHCVQVPPALARGIPQEAYSTEWRDALVALLAEVGNIVLTDPVAVRLIALLKARTDEILDLVRRADRLAGILQVQPLSFVLCHSDVHGGNVLIGLDDALYLVDWDDPIFAPRERDLMFIGGGLGGGGRSVQEEETLFYQGYGWTEVDPAALAYYRYERIVQDIAVFSQRILSSREGRNDREQSLRHLVSNFLPNGTIEIAYRSDKTQLIA
jgi:spectinomycin phosphotransferase